MKPIVIVCVIASCLVAGFIGASLVVVYALQHRADLARGEAVAASRSRDVALRAESERAARGAVPTSGTDSATQAEVASLREALAELEIEVASLREEFARRDVSGELLAATESEPEAFGSFQRDAIVKVLEEERKKEQQKREEERKQREQEAIDRMAERAAKDLGLSPADQRRLSDFMVVASAKRDETFRGGRDGGGADFRTAFDDYRTWRDGELKKTFGDQLGQQLIDYQREQRDGFGGGFPGGGQSGGQPGQGGQNSQSGGRRGG